MIRYAPAPTPPRPCRVGLVERMASDMREMAFAGETVSTETLTQRGWTPATIERFAPDAVGLARRQSIRRIHQEKQA